MIQQTPPTVTANLDLTTARKIATLHSDANDPAEVTAAITVSNLNVGSRIRVIEVDLTNPNVTTTTFTKDMDGETTLSFAVSRKLPAAAADIDVYIEDLLDLTTTARTVVSVFIEMGSDSITVLDATSQLLMNWIKVDLMQLTEGETRVPGAVLTVTTQSDGQGVTYRVTVDSNGEGIAFLKAGTYYRWGQHRTFKFVNPQVFTVTAP